MREVRQQLEARKAGDVERLAALDALSRQFERSINTRASALDRY